MYRTRWILAFMLIAAGLVWVGQGLGLIRGQSFMVDDVRWAWIGLGTAVVGIALAIDAVRRRRRAA